MATEHTKIQWTDATWNVVRGCSILSAGCTNCYAMKQARRFSGPDQPYEGLTRLASHGPIWTGKIRLVPEALGQPLRWKRPRRIFVNSMSDLFHEDVPFEFIKQVFNVMWEAYRHTFQILTKRPDRMLTFLRHYEDLRNPKAIPNVWLGVSCENQATADERVPLLLQTPAAVRFLSLEPLLKSIDLTPYFGSWRQLGPSDLVIIGGESGPGARPCNIEWIRDIVRQCKAAGIPCFVKQLGAFVVDTDDRDWPAGIRVESVGLEDYGQIVLRDRKGGDPLEWPKDLRVREFPPSHPVH